MNSVLEQLYPIGVVPVAAIHNFHHAVELANALGRGGIHAVEITFRTEAAESSIRAITQNCAGMIVGAGTVVTLQQCRAAIAAGAKFIVSPGYDQKIVDLCLEQEVAVLPGCPTTSDMMLAVQSGLEVVKFFPAQQLGGLEFLKALAPVFPSLRFMPTGGIALHNLEDYLRAPMVFACGGSYMASGKLIDAQAWNEIAAICSNTVTLVRKVRG